MVLTRQPITLVAVAAAAVLLITIIQATDPINFESKNGRIYANGVDFKFKGVSWFGFETNANCIHGIWGETSIERVLNQLVAHNFNSLRIPFSLDGVLKNEKPAQNYLNSQLDLKDKTYLEILDGVIMKAADRNITVVLDNHRGTPNRGITPLWYDSEFSEERVIEVWNVLAERYCSHWNVIAADIKNEPHREAKWGTGDPKNDWAIGAKKLGDAVLAKCPRWLIFVEGIDGTAEGEPYMHVGFWGGRLEGAYKHPVVLSNPKRCVYSPHVYGPSVWPMVEFSDRRYPRNLPAIWDVQWGRVPERTGQGLIVGEWGGTYVGEDKKYQDEMLAYLKQHSFGAFYWCINPNSGDTKGLLLDGWQNLNMDKINLLSAQPFTSVASVLDKGASTGC